MSFFRKIYNTFGSQDFFLYLCFVTVLVVSVGSFFMKKNPDIFLPLYCNPLQKWLVNYAVKDIKTTFWFLIFLALIFLTGTCTLVCGINRVNSFSSFAHFGFLILLLGQLLSHTCSSWILGNTLIPDSSFILGDTGIKIKLKSLKISFFKEDTKFMGMSGSAKECKAILLIVDKGRVLQKDISLNRPVYYKGWFLFIQDFSPKIKGTEKKYVVVMAKKDPGIFVLILGAFLFGISVFALLRSSL